MMSKPALILVVLMSVIDVAAASTTTTAATTTTTTTTETTTTTTTTTTAAATTTQVAGTSTTAAATTTQVAGTTTTAAATTTVTTGAATTTPGATANATTTTALPVTYLTKDFPAGSMIIDTVDKTGFQIGMDVVIGPGTPQEEFNKIRAFGTIELTTPLKNSHKKNTKVTKRTPADTTTTTQFNPCAPKPTTTPKASPCAPKPTTTLKASPCGAVVKKFESEVLDQKKQQDSSTMGFMMWGVGGFAGVAVAMFALRHFSAQAPHSSVSNEGADATASDMEMAMLLEPSK